jgi:phage shock protein PspC (stress-responsive transcriptional regulator)
MESQSVATARLVRRSDGRMIAGVCKGIADHFGIEPVIVRIAFVVAACFGGAGLVAYAAAWLLIPEEGDAMSVGERVIREHRWGRIAGCVLIAIAISVIARPVFWFGGHWVFATGLIVGGLYLLSPGLSGRAEAPEDAPSPPTVTDTPAAPSDPLAPDPTTELLADDGSSWPPPPPPSAPPPPPSPPFPAAPRPRRRRCC